MTKCQVAEGRRHEHFPEKQASSLTKINITDYHRWIETKSSSFLLNMEIN